MLPKPYGKHSFRVLLVDRSEETRDLFANLFASLGYEVETVATVAAALSSVPVFRPDAVFTSIFLPDGSGFELCAQLRRLPETAGARIVAITGYLGSDASRLAHEAGFDRYLVKPVQLETILEALAPAAGQLH